MLENSQIPFDFSNNRTAENMQIQKRNVPIDSMITCMKPEKKFHRFENT